MKVKLLLVLIFSLTAILSAAAQTRTVTNDDLEKYRQKRLAAERNLRENYERLGFPSPAELEKQIEQTRRERSELSTRFETEKLQREQLNLERQRSTVEYQNNYRTSSPNYPQNTDEYHNYAPNGFFSFPNFGYQNNRFRRGNFGRGYGSQPRIEYRNNLPVIVPPTPPRILAPRTTNGRRN